jgi:DNA-binding IclR family transcriptional regulator
MKNDNQVGTVARVSRLLRFIGDVGQSVPLSRIAAEVDLPLPTVHRLLGQLREEGLVRFDELTRTYGIGTTLHRIASRIVVSNPLVSLAEPYLEELVHEFDESALLGLYLEAESAVSFAVRIDGSKDLQYRIKMNTPLSLVTGASGKSILAYLDAATRATVIAREMQEAERVGQRLDSRTLEAELESVRINGVCHSEGERLKGARGIAAPVFDGSGIIGSISLTSQLTSLSSEDIPRAAQAVRDRADALSRTLGGRRPDSEDTISA